MGVKDFLLASLLQSDKKIQFLKIVHSNTLHTLHILLN